MRACFNLNRSGKASSGPSFHPDAPYGWELPVKDDAPSYFTFQAYLMMVKDGVASIVGESEYVAEGGQYPTFALICTTDTVNSRFRVVHFIMRVLGMSNIVAVGGEPAAKHTFWGELISRPGQGEPNANASGLVICNLPCQDILGAQGEDIVFRPSYDQYYNSLSDTSFQVATMTGNVTEKLISYTLRSGEQTVARYDNVAAFGGAYSSVSISGAKIFGCGRPMVGPLVSHPVAAGVSDDSSYLPMLSLAGIASSSGKPYWTCMTKALNQTTLVPMLIAPADYHQPLSTLEGGSSESYYGVSASSLYHEVKG